MAAGTAASDSTESEAPSQRPGAGLLTVAILSVLALSAVVGSRYGFAGPDPDIDPVLGFTLLDVTTETPTPTASPDPPTATSVATAEPTIAPEPTQTPRAVATAIPATFIPTAVPVATREPVAAAGALPSYQELLAYAAATWPNAPERAGRVVTCEAAVGGSVNPKAFRTDQTFGGPMQIDRASWENYFLRNYGWTWSQLVVDLEIHFAAARIIYDQAGGWFPWPVCQYY